MAAAPLLSENDWHKDELLMAHKSADEKRLQRCRILLLTTFLIASRVESIVWRKTIVNLLSKHGRARVPAEYRPIASIRLLYETFAYMILGRLGFLLSAAQRKEQHGFRSGRRIEGHLVATNLIMDKSWTVNMPIWINSVGHAGLTLTLTFVKSF